MKSSYPKAARPIWRTLRLEALVGPLPQSAYEGTFWLNGKPLPFRPIRLIQQQTGLATYFQSTALKVRFERRKILVQPLLEAGSFPGTTVSFMRN